MANPKTVHVPHFGGVDAGYQMAQPYDASKPTVVLVNSFMTTSDLYKMQFSNAEVTAAMNLLAIEPLGHGKTRYKHENFTYWDTAIVNIQVMDALGVSKAFALGTSQGGWIVTRMALLAPEKIQGIVPLGTSMDYESERTRKLGCWDCAAAAAMLMALTTSKVPTPEFQLPVELCDMAISQGLGENCPPEMREFWSKEMQANYRGDDGRRRARMATINLAERDGLHGRLFDVKCPVMWLHGTQDSVYSVANAEEEIKLFTESPSAEVVVVEGGRHFLSATHPAEVNKALVDFVKRYS